MKEITGNIFEVDADAICVTTNGCVKANGELVMGAGIAKQFADRFPELPWMLGQQVKAYGNEVRMVETDDDFIVLSIPTKEHWKDPSTMALIEKSIRRLVEVVDWHGWQKVVLPRPGCGLGGLKWEDVKAVIEPILDDRFYVITPEQEES